MTERDPSAQARGPAEDARSVRHGPHRWEVISSKLVLDGAPWLSVWEDTVRLPSGRMLSPFYRYKKGDFASIFALTDEGLVVAERRWRQGPRAVTWDMPAGYIDPGESPEAAARRELLEETGHEAERWTPMGSVTTDGNSGGSTCHFFLAQGARRVADPRPDDTEEAEIHLLPVADVRRLLETGGFRTMAASAVAAHGLLRLWSEGDTADPRKA